MTRSRWICDRFTPYPSTTTYKHCVRCGKSRDAHTKGAK